jgi:hypothetical protein
MTYRANALHEGGVHHITPAWAMADVSSGEKSTNLQGKKVTCLSALNCGSMTEGSAVTTLQYQGG